MMRILEREEQVISGVTVRIATTLLTCPIPSCRPGQGGAALVAAAAFPGWCGCASPAVVLSAVAAPQNRELKLIKNIK